jgi:hypothetical protein
LPAESSVDSAAAAGVEAAACGVADVEGGVARAGGATDEGSTAGLTTGGVWASHCVTVAAGTVAGTGDGGGAVSSRGGEDGAGAAARADGADGAGAAAGSHAATIERMIRSVSPSLANAATPAALVSNRVRLREIVSIMKSSLKPALARVTTSWFVRALPAGGAVCAHAETAKARNVSRNRDNFFISPVFLIGGFQGLRSGHHATAPSRGARRRPPVRER